MRQRVTITEHFSHCFSDYLRHIEEVSDQLLKGMEPVLKGQTFPGAEGRCPVILRLEHYLEPYPNYRNFVQDR